MKLNKYLKYKRNNKKDDNIYSLDNPDLFKSVLNLFYEEYIWKIIKEFTKK